MGQLIIKIYQGLTVLTVLGSMLIVPLNSLNSLEM